MEITTAFVLKRSKKNIDVLLEDALILASRHRYARSTALFLEAIDAIRQYMALERIEKEQAIDWQRIDEAILHIPEPSEKDIIIEQALVLLLKRRAFAHYEAETLEAFQKAISFFKDQIAKDEATLIEALDGPLQEVMAQEDDFAQKIIHYRALLKTQCMHIQKLNAHIVSPEEVSREQMVDIGMAALAKQLLITL